MAILYTTRTGDAAVRRSVNVPKFDLKQRKNALGTTEAESGILDDSQEASGDGLESSGDVEETVQDTGTVAVFSVEFERSTATALQSNITVLIKWTLRTSEISVFPCLSGVEVYYRRPKCGAVSGMVRVAGVERAAVESAVPPTTRHYVGEMRVADYTSAMSFRCDMFSERFQEYCFSYVTFGWNGSVHTVKTACLSTLMPILRTDGGFGPWSPWSPCRTSCGAASSVRYRFCNSPPPRNNGAYCQGEGIQVRRCALPPCPTPPVTLSPVQKAYVSPTCRCGCDVVLSRGQNYSVAAATGRCSAASLWRFETTEGNVLSLHFSYFLLNTSSERLYARDGPYSNSELLVGGRGAALPPPVVSSGNFLLLEYIGGPASGAHPAGGFLASVAAVAFNRSGGVQLAMAGSERPGLPTVGVFSIALLTVILVVLLGAAFYHAWQARRVARSHSCESLFSSADDADGGGGGGSGGAGWASLHTSVTSIAESTALEKRSEAEDSPESTEKYRPHTKLASKRWKDRENRRRLLVRSESADTLKPTVSESALSTALSSAVSSALSSASTAALSTADQELELDYYDYHMANASLAPGSIFGMDPLQLSLCAYDFDVTPTEELELGEMSELGTTEATQVTEVAAEGAATDAELTELTEVAEEVTDRTEVGDDIQFADDTDDDGSLKDEHDSPASVLEDKE
ncbi:Thrombospondin-2 [Amphibalanus amphitrite]|uniref:Thrombospondin-2 n=1 Tax=Amphibalanus amphitrite TaxID=1232801 RepID=A0A6A4W6T0_AMPAM|nr:Thrombospondin-2 [Amphibalanus amphitrite]